MQVPATSTNNFYVFLLTPDVLPAAKEKCAKHTVREALRDGLPRHLGKADLAVFGQHEQFASGDDAIHIPHSITLLAVPGVRREFASRGF